MILAWRRIPSLGPQAISRYLCSSACEYPHWDRRPSHGTYARRPPVRNSPNELWLRTDHEPSESLERDDAYDDDYAGGGAGGGGRHVYHGLYLNSGVSAKLHLTNWARELRQRLVPVVWCGPVYTAHRLFPAPRYARPHRLVVIQVRLERSAELHRL